MFALPHPPSINQVQPTSNQPQIKPEGNQPVVFNSYVSDSSRFEIVRESGVAFPGECFVLQGNELLFWELGKPSSTIRKANSGVPLNASRRSMAKYRNGTFWSQSEGRIFSFDPVLKRWSLILEPDAAFNQFDVTPDGSILLIGTSRKTIWTGRELPKPILDIPLDYSTAGRGNLIEVWPVHSRKQEKEVPYPEDVLEVASKISGFSGFNRTWVFEDWLVLYSPDSGHIVLFNMISGSVFHPDVPWKHLELDFLKAVSKGKKPMSVDYPKNGQPEHDIQLVPTPTGIEILFSCPYEEQEGIEQLTSRLKARGVVAALTPSVGGPNIPDRWGRAELDLLEKKIRFRDHFSRKSLKAPIWIDDTGSLASFEKVTAGWLKAKADADHAVLPKPPQSPPISASSPLNPVLPANPAKGQKNK